jgi:hypothetical protein
MGVEARKICADEELLRSICLSVTGMRGCWLRSRSCFRPRRVLADRSHKQRNVLNAIPRRERSDVQAELVGIWEQPTKSEAFTHLAASTRQVCSALSGKRSAV